tara:strand:+ start:199 stop:498 length:300 start_codon:yes stop_codon:yes gene_type:complete
MNIFNYSYKLQLNLYKDMKNSKFVIDKLTQLFEKGLVSSKDLADEILTILKSKRDEIVFRMKLTSKDEFDVLSKRVENLEKIISQSKRTKKKTKQVRKS